MDCCFNFNPGVLEDVILLGDVAFQNRCECAAVGINDGILLKDGCFSRYSG